MGPHQYGGDLGYIRFVYKAIASVLLGLAWFAFCGATHFLPISYWRRCIMKNWIICVVAKIYMFIFNVKVVVKNHKKIPSGTYVVCNHLGYLDIVVLSSLQPLSCLSSLEMKNTPVLGHMCRVSGCLFIDRESIRNMRGEIGTIVEVLRAGLTVLVFPEATSTNGETVLRFRRALYMAATQAKAPIQPLCLNYRKIDGGPVVKANRHKIFWYGDMAFSPSFIDLLMCKSISVEVTYLDTLEARASGTTADLANKSYKSVLAAYTPIV